MLLSMYGIALTVSPRHAWQSRQQPGWVLVALWLACAPAPAKAERFSSASGQEIARISSHCTRYFTRAERKYGIPKHLLMAISRTESGRYHEGLKRVVPWPWTLNIAGDGRYYDHLHDAATAIRRAQQSGTDSIDVGCMQVNLRHHPDAFTGVVQALTPSSNIDYAASFLRSNYDELGSWGKAIAAYHSRNSKRGRQYLARVRKNWRGVVVATNGKTLEATGHVVAGVQVNRMPVQMQSSQPSGRTSSGPGTLKIAMHDTHTGKTTRMSYNDKNNTGKNSAPSRGKRRMKVIQVSKAEPRQSQAITVMPTSQARKQQRSTGDTGRFVSRLNRQSSSHKGVSTDGGSLQLATGASATSDGADKPTTNGASKRAGPYFIFGRQ